MTMSNRTPRDYARLHDDWFNDPVLVAIAETHPAVACLWPVLIAMAKRDSHHADNPDGIVDTTSAALVRATLRLLAVEQIMGTLEQLRDADMITLETSGVRIRLALTEFHRWQIPKGSNAERQQSRRDRLQGKDADKSRPSNDESHPVTDASPRPRPKPRPIPREEKKNPLSQTAPLALPVPVPVPVPRRKAKSAADVLTEIAAARASLNGCSQLVDELCDMLAAANKTGTVAESRLLHKLWAPLAKALAAGVSPQAMRYGLEAAVSAGAPNVNYVLKAANGYNAPAALQPRQAPSRRTSPIHVDYNARANIIPTD